MYLSCNVTCRESLLHDSHWIDQSCRVARISHHHSAMPPGTRSSQTTQPTRAQKRKQGIRGTRDSEDDMDDAPVNIQRIDEDDDLDQTSRGITNAVGPNHILTIPR